MQHLLNVYKLKETTTSFFPLESFLCFFAEQCNFQWLLKLCEQKIALFIMM